MKKRYSKVIGSPEGEPGRSKDDPISPEAVAAFVLKRLVEIDTSGDADLAAVERLVDQQKILQNIASLKLTIDNRITAATQVVRLRNLDYFLQEESAGVQAGRNLLLEVASLPEFAPLVANALLTQLGETTATAEILSGLFPGALADKKAVLTRIAAELEIEIPAGYPPKSIISKRRGR